MGVTRIWQLTPVVGHWGTQAHMGIEDRLKLARGRSVACSCQCGGEGPARRACVTRLSVPFVLPRLLSVIVAL